MEIRYFLLHKATQKGMCIFQIVAAAPEMKTGGQSCSDRHVCVLCGEFYFESQASEATTPRVIEASLHTRILTGSGS